MVVNVKGTEPQIACVYVSACPVRMLRIRLTGDRGNWLNPG